jgi:hypothetical protein
MGTLLLGAVAISALLIGSVALVLALLAFIEVKAMQRSTHSIEYVNPQSLMASQEGGPTDADLEKEAAKAGLTVPPDDIDDAELEDL